MRRIVNRIRHESGQALVEFAFVLPLLLLFLFGIIDFGIAVNNYNANTNVANIAARMVSVLGSSTSQTCNNGSGTATYTSFTSWVNCVAQASGAPTPSAVCVADTTTNSATSYSAGDPVTVRVTSNFSWLKIITSGSGYIGGLNPTSNITAAATMRVETPPSSGNSFMSGATKC